MLPLLSEAETQAIPIIAKWLYEIQVATEAYEEAVNHNPLPIQLSASNYIPCRGVVLVSYFISCFPI